MWRPNEPVEEDGSNLVGIDAAAHAAALGVKGSLIKPSLGILRIFDPTARSSVPSSAVLILDP